ncbi:hypothetical protein FIBSPDRAFT_933264 [Athelia psychrophila]|uniref:MYND-type domain-containing protein n=1 Tax=Athelia psychrophila TaxID=1759441 RepID=A0A166HB96_9AGAM|nr:hypothetical protein FIBSPDRAFT_933264 [Fibularhizoctonia sp. CBS 109695]
MPDVHQVEPSVAFPDELVRLSCVYAAREDRFRLLSIQKKLHDKVQEAAESSHIQYGPILLGSKYNKPGVHFATCSDWSRVYSQACDTALSDSFAYYTREVFPRQELAELVTSLELPRLDHRGAQILGVIHAWQTCLHPYTPKEGLGCSVPDSMLDLVASLLSLTSLILMSHDPMIYTKTALNRLITVWPTIWTWTRTLHTHNMQSHAVRAARIPPRAELDMDSFRKHYTAVFDALRSLNLPTELSALVVETEGMLPEMMATLWIEEAKDPTATLGFRSSELLCAHPLDPQINVDVLKIIINYTKDAPRSLVDLIFGRIKRNLKQPQIDTANLSMDFTFLILVQEEDLRWGSQTLRADILSHPMIVTMIMDVLTLAIDAEPRIPDSKDCLKYLNNSLRLLVILSEGIQTYEFVDKLMATTFLTSIARIVSIRMGDRKQEIREMSTYFNTLLGGTIARFGVYRSLLSNIQRDLVAMEKKYRVLPAVFDRILKHTNPFQSLFDEYRGKPVFLGCGDRQCNLIDDGRNFRRCSGCFFVCYCSRQCQQRHWREHKSLCDNMHSSAAGSRSVRLSGPDMRFIIYMLVNDMAELTPATRLAIDSSLETTTGSVRKMLVLSYDNISGERLETNIINFDDPTAVRQLAERVPQLGELWQSSCSKQSLRASGMGITIPILALLPRGPVCSDPQAMTVRMTVQIQKDDAMGNIMPDGSSGRMHVKPLHYK